MSKSPTFTEQVRDVFHQATPTQGQRLAAHLIESLPRCPIPEMARLGRTLRKGKDALDAYFDHPHTSNGPTEAINGRLEHLRGSALGFRNLTHYITRALLETGGFKPQLHPEL